MAHSVLKSCIFTGLLVLLCSLIGTNSSKRDYYWKDWNGTAPEDAFIAGTYEGETIYVVQAFVEDYGIFGGFVQENQTTVTVCTARGRFNPLNTSNSLKVLCTKDEPFQWVFLNIDDLQEVMEKYTFLNAGYSDNVDMNPGVHIGRFNQSGNTYVGSVYWSYWLYYSNTTMGLYSWDYEILVFS